MRKLQPKTGRLKFSNLKRKLAANARPRSLASIYRTIFNFPGTSKKKIIFFGKFLLLQTFRNKQMPQFRTLNLTVYCYSKRDIAGQMQFLFLWFFFNRMNISKSQIITVYKVCLKVFVLKSILSNMRNVPIFFSFTFPFLHFQSVCVFKSEVNLL